MTKLKIVSFNVALCPALQWSFRERKENIIAYLNNALKDCDIVLLQEATGSWITPFGKHINNIYLSRLNTLIGSYCPTTTYFDLRDEIAERTSTNFPFSFGSSKLERTYCGLGPINVYDTGLLVLSKFEIDREYSFEHIFERNIDLGLKGLLCCKIKDCYVINTHLIPSNYGVDRCNEIRKKQLHEIKNIIISKKKVVVGGDMNICAINEQIQYKKMLRILRLENTNECKLNMSTYWGDSESKDDDELLDYILCKNVKSTYYETYHKVDISDHRPIQADIEW
jgi:endonuclease/exonuclease/phosphatase family metal-dependent hydrolase